MKKLLIFLLLTLSLSANAQKQRLFYFLNQQSGSSTPTDEITAAPFSVDKNQRVGTPVAITCTVPTNIATTNYGWKIYNRSGTLVDLAFVKNPSFDIDVIGAYTVELTVTTGTDHVVRTIEDAFYVHAARFDIGDADLVLDFSTNTDFYYSYTSVEKAGWKIALTGITSSAGHKIEFNNMASSDPANPVRIQVFGDTEVKGGASVFSTWWLSGTCSNIVVDGYKEDGTKGLTITNTGVGTNSQLLYHDGKFTGIQYFGVTMNHTTAAEGAALSMVGTTAGASVNSTNHLIDNIVIYDNIINNAGEEGMYLSHNNDALVSGYYAAQWANPLIAWNVITNTGRDGIQIGGAYGIRMHHNTIKNFGLDEDGGGQTNAVSWNGGSSGQFFKNSMQGGEVLEKITGTGTAAASNTQKGLWVAMSGANATSSQTTYGGYFSNTKTGTSATNVGLYSTASGGTTNLALSLLGGMKVQTGATGGDVDFLASGGSNWMRFDNTQIIRFQLGVSSNNRITPQAGGLEFMSPGGASVGYKYNFLSQAALTGTSGTNVLLTLGENASGTRIGSTLSSGTTTNKMLLITGAWNFTGSYSGILQSIDIDPTLTSETGLTYIALRSTAASGKLLWGGTTVTSGSVLADFQSTTLGFMMPRVTNIASVATPVAGMIAYDAATDKFNFRQGSGWSLLGLTQALSGTQTGTVITSDANVTSTQSISAFSSTVTSAGVSTQVIYDPSVLSNNSTAEIEITVTGIKTDGTSSFSVSVKGLFRKDNSGTVTMDVAGTQDLKELTASTVVSLVPLVSSGYPSATLTMGASSGTYAIKGITKAIITKL